MKNEDKIYNVEVLFDYGSARDYMMSKPDNKGMYSLCKQKARYHILNDILTRIMNTNKLTKPKTLTMNQKQYNDMINRFK